MMELGLRGRRALVTGASQGIGLGIARALAAEGCAVTLVARRAEVLAAEAAAIPGASFHACDLTAPGAPEAAVAAHMAAHGGLDILVTSAGASAAGDLMTLTDDQWDRSFALKFHGTVRTCRAALPVMTGGIILPVIGAAGKAPKPGFLVGAAINAALLNFTRGLAPIAAEKGIRVVSINPGPVRTPATDARLRAEAAAAGRDVAAFVAERAAALGTTRYSTPEEIGELACFLASDRARSIHGANIFIDGGQTREL